MTHDPTSSVAQTSRQASLALPLRPSRVPPRAGNYRFRWKRTSNRSCPRGPLQNRGQNSMCSHRVPWCPETWGVEGLPGRQELSRDGLVTARASGGGPSLGRGKGALPVALSSAPKHSLPENPPQAPRTRARGRAALGVRGDRENPARAGGGSPHQGRLDFPKVSPLLVVRGQGFRGVQCAQAGSVRRLLLGHAGLNRPRPWPQRSSLWESRYWF